MKLRFLALAIIILFTGTLFPIQAFGKFSDISSYHENREAIEYVNRNGLITGYSNGKFFRPNVAVNRAEFVKVLVSALVDQAEIDGCIAEFTSKNYNYVRFTDVPTSEWYASYICVATQEGLINGYPDGNFKPGKEVTFAEAAKILSNAFRLPLGSENDPWYKPYVEALSSRAAIPTTIKSFNDAVTRAEFAEMIYRLEQNVNDKASKTYASLEKSALAELPPDNRLIIEKLGKNVPLVNNVAGSALVQEDWRGVDKNIMTALQKGVVLYPGTAEPGNNGNSFIVGHSSFYATAKGNYKDIFADLSNLAIGDTFTINFNYRYYTYRIYEDRIITPDDTSVLNQPEDRQVATLMTCWPVGTNKNRRIFVGEKIGEGDLY